MTQKPFTDTSKAWQMERSRRRTVGLLCRLTALCEEQASKRTGSLVFWLVILMWEPQLGREALQELYDLRLVLTPLLERAAHRPLVA